MKMRTDRFNFNNCLFEESERAPSDVSISYIGSLGRDDGVFIRWMRDSLVTSMPEHEVNNCFNVIASKILESCYISVASRRGQCVGVIAVSENIISGFSILYIETVLVTETSHRMGLTKELINSVFKGVYNADRDGGEALKFL